MTTERQWRVTIPRRAFIDRWFRLVFRPGELKEEPNSIFIAAWVIIILVIILIYVWLGWELLEIPPREAFRILFLKGKVP